MKRCKFAVAVTTVVIATVFLSALAAQAQSGGGKGGTFTDPRDKKTYRTVRIGNRTWMAENLNYQSKDSWCYDNADSNCMKYGRLYNWDAAMKACAGLGGGWRLPDHADWGDLGAGVGGGSNPGGFIWDGAGIKLKSKTGWPDNDEWKGTDDFGFSALPGGMYFPPRGKFVDHFDYIGLRGYWWSATEARGSDKYFWTMGKSIGASDMHKDVGYSVRCVK